MLSHDVFFTLGDDPASGSGQVIILCFFRNDGEIVLSLSSTEFWRRSYLPERWYRIEFRNIDWTQRNFDFYIAGNLVQEDIPFRSPTINSVERVDLFGSAQPSSGRFDEIEIR